MKEEIERKSQKDDHHLQGLYVGCGADISVSFGVVLHVLQMSPQGEDEQE